MGKVLKEFPQEMLSQGPYPKYPWDEWTDGRIWEIEKGVDFTIPIVHMQQNITRKARAMKMKATTRSDKSKKIIFKFAPRDAQYAPQMKPFDKVSKRKRIVRKKK